MSATGTGYSPERHAVQNDSRRCAGRGAHAVEIEVRERVDVEVVADLADRQVGREQLAAPAGVHAVEARPAVRRRRHPEVHLGRAGLAQHRDHLARGGAAHDGVVDDDELLALDVLGQRVELQAHADAALLLVRLDERAPDVPVLHEAVAVGDARRAGVALRGGDPGLGHRHHHVGVDGRLARELLAHALARRVHALAVEARVRAGEVDELEEAQARLGLGVPVLAAQARRVDHHHLARLHVADVVRADDVERRGLAREHPAATFEPAEHERPEAVRVADADERARRP